jgi:hypothetical protein
MSTWYRPDKVLVCGKLAGDYHAGLLLAVIMRRYPYAKATLKGTAGTWSANQRKVWFQAAGMSRSQGDRALARLEERGLIERAHGSWAGNPNVLYVRPTKHAEAVWHTATTFDALDAVLEGAKSDQLRKLWQKWPDKDPKKLGVIAEWYEQLGGKTAKDVCCKPLTSCAQDLLQQILKTDPAIVETKAADLLPRLWDVTRSIVTDLAA